MNEKNEKCVLIIDENLPAGSIANTAAILGVTMGMKRPDIVGADVFDRDGNSHMGIIQFPIPVLKSSPKAMRRIREKLFSQEYRDLTVVDFTHLAQSCKTYEEFIEKMAACAEGELCYIGLALCGSKKKINSLTGSMALLR